MGMHPENASDHLLSLWQRIEEDFKKLRNGTPNYLTRLAHIDEARKSKIITLEQYGSTEDELMELRLLGRKAAAKNWIKHLRAGERDYVRVVRSLRHELQQEDSSVVFTLEEFGSSEDEIEILCQKGAALAVHGWVDQIDEGEIPFNVCMKYILKHLDVCKKTLADLGCTHLEHPGQMEIVD